MGLIEEIPNQIPNRKRHEALRAEIDQISSQIEENWKLHGQLTVKVHKSKTKNEDENDAKLWGWWLSLTRVKLHEIKSLGCNYRCN